MSTTTTTTMTATASCSSSSSTTSSILLGPEPTPANVAQPPQPQEKQYIPRLLYRGAFSVPDSNLLLDGLTFTINLPADDPQASLKLLEDPLPLALESMRGRPSLSFVGVEKMDDLYCDFSGGVTLHVHHRCILTYQLFAHNLCMDPITHPSGRTDLGIRVRLGDSNSTVNPYTHPHDPDVTDIVIYGRPHPSTSIMQLCVARIMPMPPPVPKPIARLRPSKPRPDDPTPRRPPVGFGGMARIGLGMTRKRSIAAVKQDDGEDKEGERCGEQEGSARKRVKRSESGSDAGKSTSGKPVFKIPPLPPARRDKERERDRERERARKERARQAQSQVAASTTITANANDDPFLPTTEGDGDEGVSELEKANKSIVKKTVVRLMSTIGISRQHPDFKDFYGHVYRGVSFALRAKLKSSQLEKDPGLVQRMERLVQSHVEMYIEERDSGVDC